MIHKIKIKFRQEDFQFEISQVFFDAQCKYKFVDQQTKDVFFLKKNDEGKWESENLEIDKSFSKLLATEIEKRRWQDN